MIRRYAVWGSLVLLWTGLFMYEELSPETALEVTNFVRAVVGLPGVE